MLCSLIFRFNIAHIIRKTNQLTMLIMQYINYECHRSTRPYESMYPHTLFSPLTLSHAISHYLMQERDCLVEGPLNNLQTSMMSLPRPKMTSNDKRLHFTALAHGAGAGTSIHASGVQGGHHMGMHGGGGYDHGDQGYYGDNMGHMGGGGGNSFYQRSWGELSSHDNSRYAQLPSSASFYLPLTLIST